MASKTSGFGTKAIHAGQSPDPSTGAIMTPIYATSTFVQPTPGVYKGRFDYSRSANPTRSALEDNLAALEGGEHGFSFASGCAALDCLLHLLDSGDHVVLSDDVYGGTFRLFHHVYQRHGISYTMVDMTDIEAISAACTDATKMIMLETPTNPTLKVIDIKKVAEVAKSHDVLFVVDNTFATPYLQNPLALGADVSWHSVTKYIGGHSDVVGGAIIVNDAELAERIQYLQNAVGAVSSPFDCFMLLRSTKTLHVRMDRHCENAMKVAGFLEGHEAVERVYYPGLESHPQHEVAAAQMSNFGGMVSLTLKGDLSTARSFLERLSIFSLAESLGGVESLVEHPAIMTHATIPPAQREELGIVDTFVRLSVGIEAADDLISDLKQALEQ